MEHVFLLSNLPLSSPPAVAYSARQPGYSGLSQISTPTQGSSQAWRASAGRSVGRKDRSVASQRFILSSAEASISSEGSNCRKKPQPQLRPAVEFSFSRDMDLPPPCLGTTDFV